MEIFPSEYQNLELSRFEKLFVRHAISCDDFGYLLLKVNPTCIKDESLNVLICSEGVVFYKFFDDFSDPSKFTATMTVYSQFVHPQTCQILSGKLMGNKSLAADNSHLLFPVSIVYVFPAIKRESIGDLVFGEMQAFVNDNCLFAEEFSQLRTSFSQHMHSFLIHPFYPVSTEPIIISNNNVNSILQRIAPEYVTVRIASIEGSGTPGADKELLVIDEHDVVARAFRLDKDQINLVNRISKDEPNQLILACAGSGKSVLLISKCFKAAQMNPDKQFLITCKSPNLNTLYDWFIDRAGLREKNVTCMTFHSLCKTLLEKNGFSTSHGNFDGWVSGAINQLNHGKIKDRYYGIFIDEVQAFDSEWYKFCFNLLENKDSKDHIFVICGDKTQRLDKLKKRGQAPWQVGEGYPVYRGGNKNIRIEKNYRNCIEINEYINRFASRAKKYLFEIQHDYVFDPDMFLRGQAQYHAHGVTYVQLPQKSSACEVNEVIKAINIIHNTYEIPYDEIAVIMFQGQYRYRLPGWQGQYSLQDPLMMRLVRENIPYCKMFLSDDGWRDIFTEKGGVRLIKFETSLGLDFRATIICGLEPFGYYAKIKKPDWDVLRQDESKFKNALDETELCLNQLYVACSRAKDLLYIIAPDSSEESVFIDILKESI